MVRIAIYSLFVLLAGATVAQAADGWMVPLPERRDSLKLGKAKGVAQVGPATAGPGKVVLPPPAHRKRVAAPQDEETQDAAPVQRKLTEADDPDVPIARENARPRAQHYGPERLRADYRVPTNVVTAVRTMPAAARGPAPIVDADVNRDFAGHIQDKLAKLRAQEGIEANRQAPVAQRMPAYIPPVAEQTEMEPFTAPVARHAAAQPIDNSPVNAWERLRDLEGAELLSVLQQIGNEIMRRNPVGTPVATLRAEYRDLVNFVSDRTGVPVAHIYRVMDLESHGGQYWVENQSSGASGLVQVRPIALEELQRLRSSEFAFVSYNEIRMNPALNLYIGMSYAAEKGQNWDHYSGHAAGYADYVLKGRAAAQVAAN